MSLTSALPWVMSPPDGLEARHPEVAAHFDADDAFMRNVVPLVRSFFSGRRRPGCRTRRVGKGCVPHWEGPCASTRRARVGAFFTLGLRGEVFPRDGGSG